jgi:hypothetical protein
MLDSHKLTHTLKRTKSKALSFLLGVRHFLATKPEASSRLYVAGKLEASSSLPTPRLHQPAGLVAKASLWLPFDVERELASLSVLAKK